MAGGEVMEKSLGQWSLRLLLVEDDRTLSRLLKQGMTEDGYEVEVVSTVEAGFYTTMRRSFDLLVIDVRLGDGSGIDLVSRLRRAGIDAPIMILTASGDAETTVQGLDAGADDYVVKPVPLDVLEARVRALHRRWNKPQLPVVRVAGLTLDLSRLAALRDGVEVDLTPTQARVLEVLMVNAGQVVDRATIADHVGASDTLHGSNVIDVHVRAIRQKIDAPFGTDTIETVRGMGYRVRRPR